MSGQYTGAQQSRSILPIVAIVIGVIALLIGAVMLAVASEAKPTLENALSSPEGDLLTQEAYERTRNFATALLVIGGLSLGGGILALVQRSSGSKQPPTAYGYQQAQPVAYGYQQAPPVPHGYQPQPQQWQAPPPVQAPPAPPPGAWPAPPPDASQRVG